MTESRIDSYKGEDLRERLMQFALRILKVCKAIPNTPEGRLVRGQLFRAGTSPSAQYREACRSRSRTEFISKIRSGQQELDETAFWLEFLERSEILSAASLSGVRQEINELLRIFSSSIKTAKSNSGSH